jgi:hypothetical protein
MEFVIHPLICYSDLAQTVQLQRQALEEKLKSISKSHVVHPPLGVEGETFRPRPWQDVPGVVSVSYHCWLPRLVRRFWHRCAWCSPYVGSACGRPAPCVALTAPCVSVTILQSNARTSEQLHQCDNSNALASMHGRTTAPCRCSSSRLHRASTPSVRCHSWFEHRTRHAREP